MSELLANSRPTILQGSLTGGARQWPWSCCRSRRPFKFDLVEGSTSTAHSAPCDAGTAPREIGPDGATAVHVPQLVATQPGHPSRLAPSWHHCTTMGDYRSADVPGLTKLYRACFSPLPALVHAVACVTAVAALVPARAWAHVKWFAPYDVTEPPTPIEGMLAMRFLLVFAGFALLVSGGFLLDRLAVRSGWSFGSPGHREEAEEKLLRAGTGAFFVALFTMGGTILTPELRTEADWPVWLQLGIAASMLSARSCALGAAGILVLYSYGVALYGAFHLADYPMFLGIAAYLGLTSSCSERLRSLRMPILYVTVCASLMWGAIEKWAYPQWTFPLLEVHPYLTLGVASEDFMVVAGFVEFALAFHILTGLGLLRFSVAGLGSIFLLAILDFGKLDAIGHLPLIIPLAAMLLHGPTPLHHRLHDARRGLVAEARRAGVTFTAAICVFFAAYYGLQHTEDRGGTDVHRRAGLVASAQAQIR